MLANIRPRPLRAKENQITHTPKKTQDHLQLR